MTFSLTILIIIVISAISWQVMESPGKKSKLVFSPYLIDKNGEYYRFLSSGFIHGSMIHLLINMYVLYIFGNEVESIYKEIFGSIGLILYLALFVGGIIVAHIPNYFWKRNHPGYASLGASGAVSGIVFASILLDPWRGIGILFIPFYPPGFVMGLLFLAYSTYASKKQGDNIDHIAHFAGAIFGFVFTILLHPKLAAVFTDCLLQKTNGCIYQYLGM